MTGLSQTPPASRHFPVIVIGGGQAGLAMSWCLKARGILHLVVERHRIGHEWATRRWDSFCLVTPNWQCQLPGFAYAGDAPHGFMNKDQIVAYLEDYARAFAPPILEQVAVSSLLQRGQGSFELATSAGDFSADQVVIATGAYHGFELPRLAERLPAGIAQLHSSQYRNPQALPAGAVLVVGSGQSGCQIAEDLHLAGRQVHLATGSAPRTARFYRGRDVVDWLADMAYYELPVHEHPLKEGVRAKANHYVTGRDGGRDIDLRRFALEGMQLYGRLLGVDDARLHFATDLAKNLDHADAVAESIKATIDRFITEQGIKAPTEPGYTPLWRPGPEQPSEVELGTAGIRSVIWSNGFRSDYRWVELPAFDGRGYPRHERGVSAVAGLYFLGLPWQYTWGSGRFSGVGRDAEHLAGQIVRRLGTSMPARTGATGTAVNAVALGY
jgi:putative flavoprotein involved in K+ transport